MIYFTRQKIKKFCLIIALSYASLTTVWATESTSAGPYSKQSRAAFPFEEILDAWKRVGCFNPSDLLTAQILSKENKTAVVKCRTEIKGNRKENSFIFEKFFLFKRTADRTDQILKEILTINDRLFQIAQLGIVTTAQDDPENSFKQEQKTGEYTLIGHDEVTGEPIYLRDPETGELIVTRNPETEEYCATPCYKIVTYFSVSDDSINNTPFPSTRYVDATVELSPAITNKLTELFEGDPTKLNAQGWTINSGPFSE